MDMDLDVMYDDVRVDEKILGFVEEEGVDIWDVWGLIISSEVVVNCSENLSWEILNELYK